MQPQITPFHVETTAIDGLVIITMKQINEDRGVIRELYRGSSMDGQGLTDYTWKQINATETKHGVIRGLHAEAMTKLVAIVEGEAFGAYVDLRSDSSSRGQIVTVQLSKGTQVLVPQGVGNGFQSISEQPSQYLYCFDAEWVAGMPGSSVCPLDPALGITWPVPVSADDEAHISRKDASAPSLAETLAANQASA